LVSEAAAIGLEALAISDHDTFAGYDHAVPLAAAAGLDLVCGIELSTKFQDYSVHLLGYFVSGPPGEAFRHWLGELNASRRDRNERLVTRLQSLGVDISLDRVMPQKGKQAGRPHFARYLIDKGYATSIEQAFHRYLGESGSAYVDRHEPSLQEAIAKIRQGGGISSLAHPIRLTRHAAKTSLDATIAEMRDLGLDAIEAYHSDHRPEQVAQYLELSRRYELGVTGGSDFHGANKPRISLGSGLNGNLDIPRSVLDRLRAM
jgi:predicted metal-dependent phosphoesterase TrpH